MLHVSQAELCSAVSSSKICSRLVSGDSVCLCVRAPQALQAHQNACGDDANDDAGLSVSKYPGLAHGLLLLPLVLLPVQLLLLLLLLLLILLSPVLQYCRAHHC